MAREGVTKVKGNPLLAKGIHRFGRSAKKRKTGAWIAKHKMTPAKPIEKKVPKVKKFGKKGEERVIGQHKARRYYPTVKVSRKIPRNFTPKIAKLRKSLTPGTVVILLSGRFRGKRVVFLKQLESGLLLVNGPFKVNGVPLRRVDQAYVIATSTKVDMTGLVLNAKLTDELFTAHKTKKAVKDEATFFNKKQGKLVPKMSAERKSLQAEVDAGLAVCIKKTPQLSTYLGARFTLTNGQYPHAIKF